MADVSHELGALRFVVDSPLSSKVAMFNNHVQESQKAQLLNPFSSAHGGRTSPKPTFSKDEYGKPIAGSLTEMRGQKANMHVMKEMLELCQIIDSEGYKVNDEPSMRVIPFGELFNIYNYISDKVVGILLRARKYKYVDFEGEMLFQRRDDNVPVFLLRPIADIRREIDSKVDEIKRGTSPAPMATSLLMDKGAHQQKLQESALSVPNQTPPRSVKARSASPAAAKVKSAKTSSTENIVKATKASEPEVTPAPTQTSTTDKNCPIAAAEQEINTEKTPTPATVGPTEVVTSHQDVAKPSEVLTSEPSKLAENIEPPVTIEITQSPEEINPVEVKTDLNNNGSECDIAINDLPTIVIETTPISESLDEIATEKPETLTTEENVTTLEASNPAEQPSN